jgi:hypothetical protein
MTENALDPPPARRPKAPRRRIALIVASAVIVVGAAVAIGNGLLNHPAPRAFDRAAFGRGSGPTPTPPPAVSPETAEKTKAAIAAMHKAAASPALEPRPVQVATVSPPAGPAASGLGVTRSHGGVAPSDG